MLEICIQTSYDQNVQLNLKSYLPVVYGIPLRPPKICYNVENKQFATFSLKHVLIDCVDVADVRQTFYNANRLSNLFTNVAGDIILQFLKEIDLYTKI